MADDSARDEAAPAVAPLPPDWWLVPVDPAAAAPGAAGTDKAAVAAYVTGRRCGARPAQVAAALGIRDSVARTYLSDLVAGGEVARLGPGLYGPADGT